jgi:hypothetical protein
MGENELKEIEANKNCLTPLKSVRSYCRWCMTDQLNEVRLCPSSNCPLYAFRMGRGAGSKLRSIRLRCLDCSGGSRGEARECSFTDCSLYPFRMGKNPNAKNRVPPIKNNGLISPEVSHRKQIFKEKPMGDIPL